MIKLVELVRESEEVNVNKEFEDAGKDLANALNNVKPIQNEDIQTAAQILDLILSNSAVIQHIGEEIKDLSQKLNIKKGIQFGSWLSKYTGNLESKFKSPLKSVIKKFTSDDKMQENITNALYLTLVMGLGVIAGQGPNDTIKQIKSDVETVKNLKAATGGDIQGLINQLT